MTDNRFAPQTKKRRRNVKNNGVDHLNKDRGTKRPPRLRIGVVEINA